MPLNVRACVLAAGAVMAILYSLCALWVAISPAGFMGTLGYLTHIDLMPLARTITWPSFLAGLASWTLATGASFGLFAWTYNVLTRAPSPPASTISMMREKEIEKVQR